MAIPSKVLIAAVKLAERHDSLASAEWVMRFFGVMTFGIESVSFSETDERCDYVNRGDTYNDTVYYSGVDGEVGEYCIGSWGDWLESVESGYTESTGETGCPNCGKWSDRDDGCGHCGYAD